MADERDRDLYDEELPRTTRFHRPGEGLPRPKTQPFFNPPESRVGYGLAPEYASGAPPKPAPEFPQNAVPPPGGETMPTTSQAKPAQPPPASHYLEQQVQDLERRMQPHPAQTRFGRIMQGIGRTAETIGTAMFPTVAENIPGSRLAKQERLDRLIPELGAQQTREATVGEAQARTELERERIEAEKQRMNMGKPATGASAERFWTDPGGIRHVQVGVDFPTHREYRDPDSPDLYMPSTPLATTVGQPQPAAPGGIPTEAPGTIPHTAQVNVPPPMAPPMPAQAPRQYTYGAPKEETAEQSEHRLFLEAAAAQRAGKPLTPEQQQSLATNMGRWGKEIGVSPDEMKAHNDTLDKMYKVASREMGNLAPQPAYVTAQDSADVAEKKVADYTARLQAVADTHANRGATAALTQGKLDEQREKQRTEADQAFINIYSQRNYNEAINAWHKSGHFARDSGLIAEQLGHGNEFGKGGIANGIGALATSPAAMAGALGLGAILNAASGTIAGYLDTLKKSGISDEGFNAMQAYYNAMIGRMLFETGTLKLPATALRSKEVISRIMNSVPPPNTPPDAFQKAFDLYYRPMEVLTTRKKFPAGYTAPTYEQIYPPTQGTPTAAPGAPAKQWNPVKGAYE